MSDMTLKDVVDAVAPELEQRVNKSFEARIAPIDKQLATLTQLNERLNEVAEGAKVTKTALDDGIKEIHERLQRGEKLRSQEGPYMYVPDRTTPSGVRIVPKLSDAACKNVMELANRMLSAKDMSAFMRDLSSGTTSAGGALLHTEYVPELLGLITLFGDGRKYFRIVPMGQKTQVFPSLNDGSGTDAQWVSEGGAPSANTEPVFGTVTLTNEILMALAGIPISLLQDANPAVGQIVASHIARRFAKAEDLAGFKGTGAGIGTQQPFTGILNDSGVVVQLLAAGAAFSNATANDFLKMQDAVETPALDSAAYYMNRTVINFLRGIKDSQGRFIYQEPSASQPAMLWDYPLRRVEAMPKMVNSATATVFALFGNLENMFMGDRAEIVIASSEHAGWSNLKVITRGFERIALKAAVPSAIAVLKTN